jgi:hypothetical protein
MDPIIERLLLLFLWLRLRPSRLGRRCGAAAAAEADASPEAVDGGVGMGEDADEAAKVARGSERLVECFACLWRRVLGTLSSG